MDSQFIKIKAKKAKEITDLFELSEQGKTLLHDNMVPVGYIQVLIENECYADAVSFFAYALPKRESTWWACLCARSCLHERSNPSDHRAVEQAELWVYKPTSDHSRANFRAAEETGYKTSAGWAAMAAFWSGDNISPIEGNIVTPMQHLTAKAVIGAVMLAAVQDKTQKPNDKYNFFLRQAIDIACGGDGRKI